MKRDLQFFVEKLAFKTFARLAVAASLLLRTATAGEYRVVEHEGVRYRIYTAQPKEVHLHWKDATGKQYRQFPVLAVTPLIEIDLSLAVQVVLGPRNLRRLAIGTQDSRLDTHHEYAGVIIFRAGAQQGAQQR